MVSRKEMADLRTQLLERISSAAAEGNVPRLARLSGLAQEVDALISEATKLDQRAVSLQQDVALFLAAEAPPVESKLRVDLWKALSPKAAGYEARRDWVSKLQSTGVLLSGHGKRYQTSLGQSVSIAFANELPHLPDRWWLGFHDEPTDIAVLLCHAISGEIHAFVLVVRHLGSSWERLSRSRDQIKFNVKKDGPRFLLLIPGDEPVDITRYNHNHTPLASAAA